MFRAAYRSYPLLAAKELLQQFIREQVMAIKLQKQATTTPKIRAESRQRPPVSRIVSWAGCMAFPPRPSGAGGTVTLSITDLTRGTTYWPRLRPSSLIKPRPQTNGMVDRFNGRISDVLATRRYVSGEGLEQTLKRYSWLYNHHIPQKVLHHQSPIAAMKEWQAKRPEIIFQAGGQLHGTRYLATTGLRG